MSVAQPRGISRPAGWVFAAAFLVSAAALIPLGFIAAVTLETDAQTIADLVWRPRVGTLLINTVMLILVAVPICIALGTGLAWLTERSDMPGRRLWSALAAAPLAVPAFVHGYAWVSLFPAMHGFLAAVLVAVLAYFPFLYLPVAATLRRLDPGIEDVGASLGLTPFRVFLRVVLPQLRIAIWGGGLLVGLHLLAEYGLFALLRFDTFTTAILDQFQSTYSGPAANMLAGILVACCLGLLALEGGTRGRARYARLGSGAARSQPLRRLGPKASGLALLVFAAVAVLALGVPLATLAIWLAFGGIDVWRFAELAPAIAQTLGLAGAGALITTLAAAPVAWLAIRAPSPLVRALEGINYVASSLPGIVVALALVTVTVRVALPLYQTLFTVLLAYLLMFLPRALIAVRASIAQVPPELEHVAQSLGRSPPLALWTITARLAAPGAAAGAALVFLAIATELTATLLLAPNGTRTLATTFWAETAELDYAAAAPYATIMVLLSIPATWLLYRESRRIAGR